VNLQKNKWIAKLSVFTWFTRLTANDWGLKLGGLETTSLFAPTNLMKIPSLAERAKHLFTPLKVRRVKFRQPA
jgi:hypothetical protein